MKLVKQTSYQDCGAACIAMMINHFYKYEIDLQQIKFYLSINDDEISFYDIIDLASNFYLKGDAFRIEQDFLELRNKTPFLAQVVNSDGLLHFVIIKEILQDDLVIYDPSKEKKQKQSLTDFLITFNNNVITFKPNIKKFNTDFKFNFKRAINIFGFDFILYLLISLISTFLFIIDTQFLQMYSNSLNKNEQDFLIYLFPVILLVLNILFKNISMRILNNEFKKRKQKLLAKMLKLIETKHMSDLFYLYQEINWVSKYENYSLKSSFASIISEAISLLFIYFIAKEIFLLILIADILYIVINTWINQIATKEISNSDREWFMFLNNIDYIKNTGNECQAFDEVLKLNQKEESNTVNNNFIEFWDKLSLIFVYIISWMLLRQGNLNFSLFFIILLLKSFSKANIYNVGQTILGFNKYRISIIKFEKIFIDTKLIKFDEKITNIKILLNNEKRTIEFKNKLNIEKTNIDLANINKTKSDINIEVYINNKNINNLRGSDIRKQMYYAKDQKINFGTIYQNIAIKKASKINVFNIKEIKDILDRHFIKITKLVKPETYTQIEKEIIKLLSIFYIDKKVILIKNDFQILTFDEIILVLSIFTKLNDDKFVILS
ncbi:cysteine peptidase family C39 domain-containing protein [Mesoplasma tabanidae]|uniref:ABC transporter ATP-binding protein/permease n=1 Tax=Mesoplasma tabanidae TaxID=219745 RepID=A0A2K8P407_9MOLU|nr:cysteine peptidase family C39 domain-containing protein [Mesoplasma tabanidae]ATZ21479.1 ABC transporter ATP-binding protein/permease [Mesoplasma tabanidae]